MAIFFATGCVRVVSLPRPSNQQQDYGWVGDTYQELGQVLIWDVGQLLAVVFGDDELSRVSE